MEERKLKRDESFGSNRSSEVDIEELLSKNKYEILKEVEAKIKKVIDEHSKSNSLIRSEIIGFKNEIMNETNVSKLWLSELEASKDSTENSIKAVMHKMMQIETQAFKIKTEIDFKASAVEVDSVRKHCDIMTPLMMHEELKHKLEEFMMYKEVIEEHTTQVDSLDKSINLIHRRFEDVNNDIEALRTELMTKASAEAFRSLSIRVDQTASKKALDDLRVEVSKCSTRIELENALQKIADVRKELQNYVRLEMIDGMKREIIDSIHRDMKHYVRDDFFNKAMESILSDIHDIRDKTRERDTSLDKILIEQRKDINILTFQFNDEPWMNGINECKDVLDTKSNITDFDIHKSDVDSILNGFDTRLKEFRENVNEFELVIERFDEVILDKASKQDVQVISSQLPSFSIKSSVDPILKNYKDKLDDLDARTLETFSNVASLLKRSKNWQSTETQSKTMKKDTARLTAQIEDLRVILKEKSDKADFLTLLDTVIKREELIPIRELLDAHNKQLEIATVLVIALTKSTLKSNESCSYKEKQRFDIYKHLSSLLKWMSSSEVFDVEKLISSSRRILQGSMKKTFGDFGSLNLTTPTPLEALQTAYKSTSPSRTSAKGKRLMGQHLGFLDDDRTSVDLPPIRQ